MLQGGRRQGSARQGAQEIPKRVQGASQERRRSSSGEQVSGFGQVLLNLPFPEQDQGRAWLAPDGLRVAAFFQAAMRSRALLHRISAFVSTKRICHKAACGKSFQLSQSPFRAETRH